MLSQDEAAKLTKPIGRAMPKRPAAAAKRWTGGSQAGRLVSDGASSRQNTIL
jgi:hypothetical protein